MGRFTSPDPHNTSGTPGDPQSWNGYAYARNNPLLYTDPDGEDYQICDQQGQNCRSFDDKTWQDFRNANGIAQQASGQLYVTNEDGSYTNVGTASWYDPTATNAVGFLNFGIKALAANYVFGAAEAGLGMAAEGFAAWRAGRTAVETASEAANDARTAGSAAERLPNLAGKSRAEGREALRKEGFEDKGLTQGGYEKWYHPDGSRVQIRPDGEVVRTAPKTGGADGTTYRPRIGPDGARTESHNTGERLN